MDIVIAIAAFALGVLTARRRDRGHREIIVQGTQHGAPEPAWFGAVPGAPDADTDDLIQACERARLETMRSDLIVVHWPGCGCPEDPAASRETSTQADGPNVGLSDQG